MHNNDGMTDYPVDFLSVSLCQKTTSACVRPLDDTYMVVSFSRAIFSHQSAYRESSAGECVVIRIEFRAARSTEYYE